MANYDNDGTGVVRVVNDLGVVEFDKVTGVNRPGWLARVRSVGERFKNISESTGKCDTKHGSTG
jgi:hypothetical protein